MLCFFVASDCFDSDTEVLLCSLSGKVIDVHSVAHTNVHQVVHVDVQSVVHTDVHQAGVTVVLIGVHQAVHSNLCRVSPILLVVLFHLFLHSCFFF